MNGNQKEFLVEESVKLATRWLIAARQQVSKDEQKVSDRLKQLVDDPASLQFAMQFIDTVSRPDDIETSANQIASLAKQSLPSFLSPGDRFLFKTGGYLAPYFSRTVVKFAQKRMRQLVGDLVVEAQRDKLVSKLQSFQKEGFSQNINLLGEAVLGEREANKRYEATLELIRNPSVGYVSVKLSAIASRLNYWDYQGSLDRVTTLLYSLFREAQATSPVTFINLDMEEYHDLQFTVDAFRQVLDTPELRSFEAGIVLQTYLPDSYAALRSLVAWSTKRKIRDGGEIKIRLVKGANLAMERVEAALSGWPQAPYSSKSDVDANYKRCVDWLCTKDRMFGVRVGIASHNIFDLAWAHLLAEKRQVSSRVQFEMLQGMAPSQSRVVEEVTENDLLLYMPVVAKKDFDVAIGYLFRRLEENSNPGNFLRSLFTLEPGSETFVDEVDRFKESVSRRWEVSSVSNRVQAQPATRAIGSSYLHFINEPPTDASLEENRFWMADVLDVPVTRDISWVTEVEEAHEELRIAREGQQTWKDFSLSDRRRVLHTVSDEFAKSRGDFISCMAYEAKKTCAQSDVEISEAIDFARYYADQLLELDDQTDVIFEPYGVVTVASPWNFPVAIAAGGVLAALAAGNSVILKPSPETPQCAKLVAECCWAAGIPSDALRFVAAPDGEASKLLITDADAVVLTGSTETAKLFQSWKPEITLFAETSGKNAIVVTPSADIDLAVSHIVSSAFGHAGQKCSAASLVIGVGGVTQTERFRSQLQDAAESFITTQAQHLRADMTPLVLPVEGNLHRALTVLDDDESWLVEPKSLDDSGQLWSPGVRVGVKPGSWFHQTECFGPVLGIMEAEDLATAVIIQNDTMYGLTGGIESLDSQEIEYWLEHVQIGNAYVNRSITGAVVRRQPFGGWKKSVVGVGSKAGGSTYVQQFGVWKQKSPLSAEMFNTKSKKSDKEAWAAVFSVDHDPSNIFCESNILRYRPYKNIGVYIGRNAAPEQVERVLDALEVCGISPLVSNAEDTVEDFLKEIVTSGVERLRIIGEVDSFVYEWAVQNEVQLVTLPVTSAGLVELSFYCKEQSISRTTHRFGYVGDPNL